MESTNERHSEMSADEENLLCERGDWRATVREPEIKWKVCKDIDPFESM